MTARHVRKAISRQQIDRDTWAGNSLLIMSYDTTGVGVIETELLDFGLVFETVPFFAFGVELLPGGVLIEGSFPKVTVGVKEWKLSEVESDARAVKFYLGAFLWISIDSVVSYNLRFRLSFEGTAIRNVELFRGQ